MDRAVQRLASRNTAPGPDGVPGRALIIALPVLGDKLRQIFTEYFGLDLSVVCYADNTLTRARESRFEDVLRLTEQGVACAVENICELGLRMAL